MHSSMSTIRAHKKPEHRGRRGGGGGGGTEGGGASRGAGIPEVNRVVPDMNALVNRRSLTSR